MLKPPTNLPKPTADNLGQYKPKEFFSALVLLVSVAWIIGSYLKFGDNKLPKNQFLFWVNSGLAGCIAYLSIQMDGLRDLLRLSRYAISPTAYAIKTWTEQESHRAAYLEEQQQLKSELTGKECLASSSRKISVRF